MKKNKISCEQYEDHINIWQRENHANSKTNVKILYEKYENQKNNIIQSENNEHHEHSRIPFENYKHNEKQIIPKENHKSQ
jgi:hypothetical protein